jgi:hypothetical protein
MISSLLILSFLFHLTASINGPTNIKCETGGGFYTFACSGSGINYFASCVVKYIGKCGEESSGFIYNINEINYCCPNPTEGGGNILNKQFDCCNAQNENPLNFKQVFNSIRGYKGKA